MLLPFFSFKNRKQLPVITHTTVADLVICKELKIAAKIFHPGK